MKYIDSDFAFAALLRQIDSYFAEAGPSVLRKECELLIKPPATLVSLRSLHYVADCFPAHLHLKSDKCKLLQPLSTANLAPILAHESLFAFDLCRTMAPSFPATPIDAVARTMSHHPGCTNDIIAQMKNKSFYPSAFTYSDTADGTIRIRAWTSPPRSDQLLGDKLYKLLCSVDLKPVQPTQTEPSTGAVTSDASKSVSTPSPALSKPKPKPTPPLATSQQKPTPTVTTKASAHQVGKATAAALSAPKVLATIAASSSPAQTQPAPIPAPVAAPIVPALPQDGILTMADRHKIYLIRSFPVADILANAIISLNPARLAFASTGDCTVHELNNAIDVIQLAIVHPDAPGNQGGRQPTAVFLWDLARATSEDRARMIQSLARVLASVTSLGGKIVVHDAQTIGNSIATQDWFDLGAVVETKYVMSEWCALAHEAQGLVAVMDQQAKGPHGNHLSPALVMSAAQRAKLLAPVAHQRVSPTASAQSHGGGVLLNDVLKSCSLPVNNVHATVQSLLRKELTDFHELTLKHAESESDADGGWYIDSAVAPPANSNALDIDSGFGTAATPRPDFVRKRYWDLGTDKLMLARAAAQQVDQLIPALDVLESNVAALMDWKRRANAYFAATQHMVRGQWSLNPKLPKYIAIQARFTSDGRFIWRYASHQENSVAAQDLGLVGASDELQSVHDQFTHRTEQEVLDLLALLPHRVREAIGAIPDAVHSLNEVILDLGEPPRLRFFALSQEAVDLKHVGNVTQEDIDAIVEGRKFSSDRRGGINGQLHRISWIANRDREAVGLTIRVGRACPPGEGVTQMLLDLVKRGESVLFLGKPGSGKTHTLRDFVARLSDAGNNVMIVDTSNEVGGPGNVKHFSLHKARRLQVRDRGRQFEVILEAVQNHTPDIVCIDEISDAKEVAAARSVATRVKGMVATAHGDLASVLRNKIMRTLLGGLQTAIVGDARAKELGGRKTVTTRAEESLFTTVVELVSRTEVRVFRDVNRVVDTIVHPHGFPWAERRWLQLPAARLEATGEAGVVKHEGVGFKYFLAKVEPFEKPDFDAEGEGDE